VETLDVQVKLPGTNRYRHARKILAHRAFPLVA
jgi:hypothetical protein